MDEDFYEQQSELLYWDTVEGYALKHMAEERRENEAKERALERTSGRGEGSDRPVGAPGAVEQRNSGETDRDS